MGVELIDDKEPRGLRIGGDGVGTRPRKVFFSSAWPNGGRYNFPSHHVAVRDQALRPVAQVFLLRALDQTGFPWQGRCGTLERLYPGLLVRTDDMTPVLSHGWCMLIDGAHGRHLGGEHDGVIRLGVEPVLDPMGPQIRLILKNARHCGC